jgi:hypothetical protein
MQRHHPVGMADDAGQLLDLRRLALLSRRSMVASLEAARISIVYEVTLIRRKLNFATQ